MMRCVNGTPARPDDADGRDPHTAQQMDRWSNRKHTYS